jgi:predicted CXXCH cytochrome family protein
MSSEIRPRHELANWMELDYFRRRTLFRRWRLWLLGALVAGVLVAAGLPLVWGRRTFQAGPLSPPHALFNQDCGLCHQDSFRPLARLWPASSATSVPDSACRNCHAGSHHNDRSTMGTCVGCHKEHRGHDALVRIDDRRCTACHAQLDQHADLPPRAPDYGTAGPYANHVRAFTAGQHDHPDFRRRQGNEANYPDPGTIQFNHAMHLDSRGVRDLDREQLEKQLKAIGEKGFDPGKLVLPSKQTVLACADCHTLDADGRYFQPISYEQHCGRCHPLSIQVVGAWKDDRQKRLAWEFARTPVRHPSPGGSPRDVRADLRQRLAEFIRGSRGDAFLVPPLAAPAVPLPDRDPPDGSLTKEQYAWVNFHLAQTERVLFDGAGGCRHCHEQITPATATADGLPVQAKPNVPARWWRHAVFSHASHRMLDCAECHDARGSETNRDVLLPGKQTCLRCHDARATPRARSDCIECHRYHDPKLQRPGAPEKPLTIEQALGR